jgi:hypothetical protein
MSEKKIPTLKEILKTQSADDPNLWPIINDNPSQFVPELIDHFGYLADTSGYQLVLESIMSTANFVSKTHDSSRWRIIFNHDGDQIEVLTGPPLPPDRALGLPDYYRSLLIAHSWLRIEDWELHSHSKDFDEDLEFGDVPKEFRPYLHTLTTPIRCGSNLIFYHPCEKNAQGLPMICYSSSQKIESIYGINAGAYMLNYWADLLDIQTPQLINEHRSERFAKYRV